MNVNSKQPAPTINSWVANATTLLSSAGIPTARLDSELILSHVLQTTRTWLIAHQNDNIDNAKTLQNADKLLAKRLQRIPLAYLTNHKEFYNRSFFVNESVLIPRPESETIIELVKESVDAFDEDVAERRPNAPGAIPGKVASEKEKKHTFTIRLLDVGTGSGCLGITAKLEVPSLSVTVSDISTEALSIARKNAHQHGAKPIRYVQSNLLGHWMSHENPKKFDIIIANLPYVDRSWQRSPETDHEPAIALFADDNGVALIKKCIQQASILTSVNGYLILEADPEQHDGIVSIGNQHGFTMVRIDGYIVTLQRN